MPEADMNREDITRMAREAGFDVDENHDVWITDGYWLRELERFANLVAAAERNRTWTQDHWTEYERSIAATEREACAKTVMEYDLLYIGSYPINEQFADAIRARGQE
jgi:hypothetical protein